MISTGGSWSVVVLVGAFGLQFFTAILTYGTGFIHLSLLEVYKESDATTSIVGSLFINLMSVTGTPNAYQYTQCPRKRKSITYVKTHPVVIPGFSLTAEINDLLEIKYQCFRFQISTCVCLILLIKLLSKTYFYLHLGPLTSYIIDRIGCRVTASLGGILLVVGLIGSHFASSLWALIVTYGIISGLGSFTYQWI